MEMTTEEIKALQTELGVTADGIIGPNTRAAAQDRVNNLRMGQDIDPNIFSVTGTTGLVRGSDVTEEEVDEPFTESECACPMCSCFNTIYTRWEKFTPQLPLEKVLVKCINEIN